MTLATGNPDTKWSRSSVVAVIFLLILLIFTLATALFYIFCIRKRSKAQIAEMEQFIGPVKKRVIFFSHSTLLLCITSLFIFAKSIYAINLIKELVNELVLELVI